jgi:hypothetical protein
VVGVEGVGDGARLGELPLPIVEAERSSRCVES